MLESKFKKLYKNLITQVSYEHAKQIEWQCDDQNDYKLHRQYGNWNNWLNNRPIGSSSSYGRSFLRKPLEKTGELCPKCNSPLVKRKGPYGEFVGCSNYPTCKYIKRKNNNFTTNNTYKFNQQPQSKDVVKQIKYTDQKRTPIKITKDGMNGVIIYNSYPIKDCLKTIGTATYLNQLKAWRVQNISVDEITNKIETYIKNNNL